MKVQVLWLLSVLSHVTALYNTISTWEKRCFVEDVPDNTMIKYKWAIHLFNDSTDEFDVEPTSTAKMYLSIKKKVGSSPEMGDAAVRRTQELKGGTGTMHFYAEENGEFYICFELHPSGQDQWEMTHGRFHVSGDRSYQDEEKELIEETKDSIINALRKNMRKVQQIKMEQKYYKEREQSFRATSYLTSARVVWYGAVTALTVVTSGLFMMHNLKSFFIKKKLV